VEAGPTAARPPTVRDNFYIVHGACAVVRWISRCRPAVFVRLVPRGHAPCLACEPWRCNCCIGGALLEDSHLGDMIATLSWMRCTLNGVDEQVDEHFAVAAVQEVVRDNAHFWLHFGERTNWTCC
jgi:hypothetical protein